MVRLCQIWKQMQVDRVDVRMYAVPAQQYCAQQLQQAYRLPVNNILRTSCRSASSGRQSLVSCRAAFTIPVGSTAQLEIDRPEDVFDHFGQPGDFVKRGVGAVYWINGKQEKPYVGPSSKNTTHDGMFGGGRFLAQNKGLVLYACNKPLPGTVAPANPTEKAIMLAIAMQESEYMDNYDSSKTGLAENKSCLNVCMDMLLRANGNYWPSGLSATDELRLVVGCMLQWLRGQVSNPHGGTEHLKDTLNFLRGGSDSFDSNGAIHNSRLEVDTSDYINAIASIYRELRWPSPTPGWDDNMGKRPDSTRPGTENWDSKNLWANNVRIEINIPGI